MPARAVHHAASHALAPLAVARPLLQRAVKGRQEVLGLAQPNTLASMTKLVDVLMSQVRSRA